VETKPLCWLPPVVLFTCQVTALLGRFVTEALNCCVVKTATLAGLGVTITEGIPAVTVTMEEPSLDGSACEVAVTVTCAGFGTVAGAV